jgi:hypothetical protein
MFGFHHTRVQVCKLVFLSGLSLMSASTLFAQTISLSSTSGNDEETFVFMDRCPNGVMYRLKAYQKLVGGVVIPYYDYDGPAGQGTIQSQTPPKTIAVRVCRALAEIRSDI